MNPFARFVKAAEFAIEAPVTQPAACNKHASDNAAVGRSASDAAASSGRSRKKTPKVSAGAVADEALASAASSAAPASAARKSEGIGAEAASDAAASSGRSRKKSSKKMVECNFVSQVSLEVSGPRVGNGGRKKHPTSIKAISDTDNAVVDEFTVQLDFSRDKVQARRKERDECSTRRGAAAIFKLEGLHDNCQDVAQALISGVYDCAVCIQNIAPQQETWACCCCMGILHLNCATKWQAQQLGTLRGEISSPHWCCPSCRVSLPPSQLRYTCFCGSVAKPKATRGTLPHSCGEQCRRKDSRRCPHPCQSLCHPGPCPPCSAIIRSRCFCGLEEQVVRCSAAHANGGSLSCGSTCNRPLDCGLHSCNRICHPGPCSSCQETAEVLCHCGRHVAVRQCGFGQMNSQTGRKSFSCGAVCGKVLLDLDKICLLSCHDGPCPSPGSLQITSSSKSCAKLLTCMQHSCSFAKGHSGPCESCSLNQSRFCGCGSERITLKCSFIISAVENAFFRTLSPNAGDGLPLMLVTDARPQIGTTFEAVLAIYGPGGLSVNAMERLQQAISALFKCKRVCNTLKNCGRHRCSSNCCDTRGNPDVHECALTCGRQLRCGLHSCEQLCHRGPCKQCPVMYWEELSCTCGYTVLPPPQPCGTTLPECSQPCSLERSCGHAPTHPCHPRNQICLPCLSLVDKQCGCGRRLIRNVACSSNVVSCGQVCGRALPCNAHLCPRTCHYGSCLAKSAAHRVGLPKVAPRSDPQNQARLLAACEDEIQSVWDCTTQAAIDNHFGHGWGAAYNVVRDSPSSTGVEPSVLSHLHESVNCDYVCACILPCGHSCQRLCHGLSSCFSSNLSGNPCGLKFQNLCRCGCVSETVVCSGKYPIPPISCTNVCTQPTISSADNSEPIAASSVALESISTDMWGLDLILSVRNSIPFVLRLESVLSRRLASIPTQYRWKPAGTWKPSPEPLWPMPSEQRYIVHRICQKYGITCSSLPGAEATRVPHITLTESCMEPSVILSQAVSLYCRSPESSIDEIARRVSSYVLIIYEVETPCGVTDQYESLAFLRPLFRRFNCRLIYLRPGCVLSVFEDHNSMKDCLDTLGGGLRHKFRLRAPE